MSLAQVETQAVCIPLPSERDASWYAVQLRCRFEKIVAAQLQHKDIETFVPFVREVHRWTDRRQVVERPLFPGYGFVRVPGRPDIHLRVLQTAGVIGFVASNGKPVPVPEHQIESVRLLLSECTSCAVCPFVKAGQRVRIEGGCLDGVEGIFVRSNGDTSLVISIDAIERSVMIRIRGYNLRVI
jgi:transcription antitermination factor NusG